MDASLSASFRSLTLLSERSFEDIDEGRLEQIVGRLVAAANSLSLITPLQLRFDRSIGAGTSFRVDREILTQHDNEPYYVAVKHMIVKAGRDISRSYRTLVRELRIFTHPPLRGHTCMLRAIGFGWSDDAEHGNHPYLVVDFSDHGTISAFLRRCNTGDKTRISLSDRRELALDIAVGLKALHDNRFVHGDVKPDNVLVFDTQDDTIDRIASIAKISDFGSTISEDDIRFGNPDVLGTPKYSAPELDLDTGEAALDERKTFESLARCDVYSFGLLLWEAIKSGLSYDERMDGASPDAVHDLRQEYYDEKDGLLKQAREYCSSLQYPTERLSKSPAESHPRAVYLSSADDMEFSAAEFQLINILKDTLAYCLRDDPNRRRSMGDVVKCLARGTTEERQPASHRTRQIGVPSPNSHFQEFGSGVPYASFPGFWHLRSLPHRNAPNSSFRQVASTTTNNERYGIVEHQRGKLVVPEPKRYIEEHFSLFETSMVNLGRPQWGVQTRVVEELRKTAQLPETRHEDPALHFGGEPISEKRQALLQLSVCYHIGFGVEPDGERSLDYLDQAADIDSGNPRVMQIRDQVEMALHPAISTLRTRGYETSSFSERVRVSQQRVSEKVAHICRNLDGIFDKAAFDLTRSDPIHLSAQASTMFPMVMSHTESDFCKALAEKEEQESIRKGDLYATLTIACRYGRFEAAVALATAVPRCIEGFFKPAEEHPTPLHWLINFADHEAVSLAELLVRGPPGSQEPGICSSVLDAIPDDSIFLPEHCMELHGSPLHWAVRTGNLPLVKALVGLGCDVNSRWISETAFNDGQKRLDFSPLDIAIIFHMPEIADFLLQQRPIVPEFLPDDEPELWMRHHAKSKASPLHLVGHETQPFARFIIHGSHYREAVQQTLSVAVKRCLVLQYKLF